MTRADENGMWNLVMFDLPVGTKTERRAANQFRILLIDLGWQRDQFSVYVRYSPTGVSISHEIRIIKSNVPPQGKVEVVAITDRQWSKAIRIINRSPLKNAPPPELLTLF